MQSAVAAIEFYIFTSRQAITSGLSDELKNINGTLITGIKRHLVTINSTGIYTNSNQHCRFKVLRHHMKYYIFRRDYR